MFHFKSLNSKLIAIYLLLVSLSLIVLLSILETRSYLIHQDELKAKMHQLISVHRTAFTKAVWEYDFDQIRLLLNNIEFDPNFRGAIVYDSLGKIVAQTGDVDLQTADPEYLSDTALNYESQFHSEPVGRLVLIFHKEGLYRRLTERLAIDALILAVLISSVFTITLLVTRRLIIAPIARLHSSIEKMRNEKVRETVQWDSNDELGQVVHAYNEMQESQLAAETELKNYKQHLEERVAERTEELRKNQQLLSAIVDNSSALIYVKQANGKYLMVNRAWCTLVGLESDEVLGKTDQEIFPADVADQYRESDLKVLRTAQPVSEEEPLHFADTEHTLISHKFPLLDSQGTCYATCGIASDITERKTLEQELIIAKETAEEANRSKSDFLANMSHEIRTPMNGIIGFTTLALKTDLSDKQRNFLNKIRTSADALLTLINDILDYSKIEAGKLDIENTPFDLSELLDDLADLFGEPAARKNIEFVIHKAANVPESLLGDPLRLRQILINLIGNAIKFTERGEVVVEVSLAEHDAGGCTLRFSIRDTGIGIATENTAKLFSSFTQADGSTTRKFGGTGLGLAICKQLVTLMHGRIGVHSMLGQGSTFWCEIPFENGQESLQHQDTTTHRFRVNNFLIVEDNPTSLLVLQEMLQEFGFRHISAGSGERALEVLHKQDPASPVEAVLLDWKLPGIDGLETARKIRATDFGKDLPIVMITAFGHEFEKHAISQIGLTGFLSKPIQQSALFDTLVKLFSERRQPAPVLQESPESLDRCARLSGTRILLAEDNPINQEVALSLLKDIGVAVDIANNGLEALEAVEKESYDIVLMDIQMPEMDGYQATAIIRQRFSNAKLPIIAMTAHAMEGDREKCIDGGMNDYISKPIDPDELIDILFRWVKKSADANPTQTETAKHAASQNRQALPEQANLPPMLESIPGFDLKQGIQRLGNKPEMYLKLLKKFVEYNSNIGQQIDNAISNRRLEEAYHLLHTLKGVAGNLAATDLLEVTVELEESTRARIAGNPKSDEEEQHLLAHFLEVLESTLNTVKHSLDTEESSSDSSIDDRSKALSEQCAKDAARRIRDATFMGDLSELQSIAESLPTDSYWAHEVFRLTDNFDFDGLEKLAYALDNLH